MEMMEGERHRSTSEAAVSFPFNPYLPQHRLGACFAPLITPDLSTFEVVLRGTGSFKVIFRLLPPCHCQTENLCHCPA